MQRRRCYHAIVAHLLCFLAALTPICFGDNSSTISSSSNSDSNNRPQEQLQKQQQHRQLASLAEKWNITGPVKFNYTASVFSLTYLTSDFILDNMVQEQLYDENCAEGGNVIGSTYLSAQTTLNHSVPDGTGDAVREVLVQITLDPNTISSSNIYSEQSVNNQMVATVRFCHRFMLFTTGGTPIEVNFRETIVTLQVNLTDGFNIGTINVAAKDKLVQTANVAYQVEGYQCDYTNIQLTELELATKRSQGSVIRVCVRPDAAARADGIFMRSIDSFVFQRDYGGSIGTVTQAAVEDRKAASNQLTQLFCTSGDAVCAFDSVLTAVFFQLPGSVDGIGIATMQFGDQSLSNPNRRQLLRGGDHQGYTDPQERSLQEVAAVAQFDLTMELVPKKTPTTSGAVRLSPRGASVFVLLVEITIVVLPILRLL